MTEGGRLGGTRAFITGASSGIGAATAALFAEEGAAVALAARRSQELRRARAAMRVR